MAETIFVAVTVEPVADFDVRNDEQLLNHLTTQAQTHGLRYLLAYHDDGVVWGRFENRQWAFSAGKFAISPPFRALTLQECRAFGPTAELLIWHNNGTLKASILTEGDGSKLERFSQTQLLWGDRMEAQKDGFSLLREGAQDLRHAVPLALANVKAGEALKARVRLTVYHYIDYENDQAYVRWSRLTAVEGG